MSEEKGKSKKGRVELGYKPITVQEGYQPAIKGYQPLRADGNLDVSNPPQGGSGVPPKVSQGGSPAPSASSSSSEKTGEKD